MAQRTPPDKDSTLEGRVRTLVRRLGDELERGGAIPEPLAGLLDDARKTLKASEDRYQRLVTHAGAVIAELSPDGTVLSVNDAIAKVTGFRPQELVGQPWWDKLFPGEYRRGLWRLYRRLRRGDVAGLELRLQNKHRTEVVLEISTANVYADGGLQTINLFGVDVTPLHHAERELERTRAELQEKIWERTDQLERINAELQIEIIEREQFERALRKSEERFRRAVDNIPANVVIYDADRHIRFVNARALSQWELPEREVIGCVDEELFPSLMTETYLPVLRRALRTRRPQSAEIEFELGGRAHTSILSFVPLLDAEGDVEEVLSIGYDITERRRIEEDLRLRHRELQTLNRISEIALTRRSLPEAYEATVRAVYDAIGFDSVMIEIYEPERERLIHQASIGIESHPDERPLDDFSRQVLEARQPLIDRNAERGVCFGLPMVVHESAIGLIMAAGSLNDGDVARHPDAEGRVMQLLASIANYLAVMTDRQRAEEALRESEAQRARAEQFSLLMVARIGLDGRWLRVPPTLCAWLGYTGDELLQLHEQDVTHPEDVELTEAAYQRMRRGEVRSVDLEKRYTTRSGRAVWSYVNVSVIPDAEGRPLHFLQFIRDISEQKRAEEELRLAARVFESSAEAILILDEHRRIVNVNTAFSEITGYPPEQVTGSSTRILDAGRQSVDFYHRLWDRVNRAGQWQGELWGRRYNGEEFPSLVNIAAVRDERGRAINYVVIFRDITEIKRSQEELERLANFDSLTALPNRNLFHDRLRHGLDRARRNRGKLAVVFVDLDNFKVINDTLGHDAGDALLKRVADRLRRCVRSEDTVARLGGDEFVILLEDVADITHVADTAQRVNDSLFIPMELDGQEVDITGSIGISVFPDDAEEAGTLLKNADTAMYVAKEQGRNTYRFFTGGMNQKAVERLGIESGLRKALERDEFFLVYQPQVDVRTGRAIGVEANIRWRHPEQGVIMPGQFIPVAEATSLIEPIGDWVLREVCRQIRIWREAGVDRRRVAVNLSARQFRQRDIAERIIAIAQAEGVDPSELELELTESAVMQDPDETNRLLTQLKESGVRIAIDDFGTGYSSLSQLKRYPIDHLKIDMSFVHDVVFDADDAAISTAIISMAHDLSVSVIAEGVETQEQFDFLSARGCDEVQGFLFSRPLSPGDVAAFYSRS